MNARAVILALFCSLGVSGCVSADPDLRAKWYLYNPEPLEQKSVADDFKPDIYIELVNVGKKLRSIGAVYMNGPKVAQKGGLIPAGSEIAKGPLTLGPGETRLLRAHLMVSVQATNGARIDKLRCAIPIRLYVADGKDGAKFAEVLLANPLPSALAPERRHLECPPPSAVPAP